MLDVSWSAKQTPATVPSRRFGSQPRTSLALPPSKVELVQVRQTFSRPLRSGWADCVVLFRFHSDNPKLCPIMELRLLHLDLANVRERADTVRNNTRS